MCRPNTPSSFSTRAALAASGTTPARSAADALKNSGASSKPQLVYPPMNEWTVPCGKYGTYHAQS